MKVSRFVEYYNNNIPKKLSEAEYYKARNSLPIYPKPKNPLTEVLGENFWLIFFIWFPPIWLLLLVNGTFESMGNHYSAVKKQNEITKLYFDAIYTSNSYQDYISKYDRIR